MFCIAIIVTITIIVIVIKHHRHSNHNHYNHNHENHNHENHNNNHNNNNKNIRICHKIIHILAINKPYLIDLKPPPAILQFNSMTTSTASAAPHSTPSTNTYSGKEKPIAVRQSNITAAKAVADVIRSSLGPRGMDKMIRTAKGQTIITNDGATILKHMNVIHPCSKMLVELSESQDAEAGDGTTSVVVIAGALLGAAERLLEKGLHPSLISDAFRLSVKEAASILSRMSLPILAQDRPSMIKGAVTSLNSKVVAPYAQAIAAIAVDAVLSVSDATKCTADIRDIRVIKKVGGTIEDCFLLPPGNVLLKQTPNTSAGGPSRMEKAKIALIQFQLSAPKTDMEGSIVINDYQQMDRVLAEERAYILNLCKKIKKTGCNVLLVQKSILRDAVSELALSFLTKLKIVVVQDIERDEVEFLSKSLNLRPISDIETFSEDKLAQAAMFEEVNRDGGRWIEVTGVKAGSGSTGTGGDIPKTASVVVRGANHLVLEEVERSLHDAISVVRCLIRNPALIAGGGAPETRMAVGLTSFAERQSSSHALAIREFGESLLTIPTILAENAGLPPVLVVTQLRSLHMEALAALDGSSTNTINTTTTTSSNWGINVRKGTVTDMLEEGVLQPLLVSMSAIELAAETVIMILKIDDIVACR